MIDYLFDAERMDATKREYHLNHESSFRDDLMDCLRLLIRFKGNKYMDAADQLISIIEDNLNKFTLESFKSYVNTQIEALSDHGSGAKSAE